MKAILRAYSSGSAWLAVKITAGVGSMTCAYLFAVLAIAGAPGEIAAVGFPTWFAQSFLQLVLLSVIIVGQNLQARKSEIQATETHDAVMEELRLLRKERNEAAPDIRPSDGAASQDATARGA